MNEERPFLPTTRYLGMRHGRSHTIPWLNMMNYGRNGRSHPTTWLNLMNVGRTAVTPPRLKSKD
ncbi:MAG: hypothetical protein IPM76_11015 [Chloroflexi bacterium]|nr:hypothetical protein [Chloroflexota bacterium]